MYERLSGDSPSTHEELFEYSVIVNLRFCVNHDAPVENQVPALMFQLTQAPRKRSITMLRQKRRATIVDMDGPFAHRQLTQLAVVKDTPYMVQYKGKSKNVDGHVFEYDLRIRTDVCEKMKSRSVVAMASLTVTEQIGGFFGRRVYQDSDYDIYSYSWEQQQRPDQPAY
jgi:hypothetical protein